MSALVIDGKIVAKRVLLDLKSDVEELVRRSGGVAPTLAVVLVGDDPASQVYVNSKSKKAQSCGIRTIDVKLAGSVSQAELEAKLRSLSAQADIDGILLQLPLPKSLNEFDALMCIPPHLDVDGLHPQNQGLLLQGKDGLRACTPLGSVILVEEGRKLLGESTKLDGLHAVVVGRSILVGKPVALMLLERQCTVTMCHSRTANLAAECQRADILIAAIGKPEFIKSNFIKPGAIVIDVGINRLDDGRLVGDVAYEEVKAVAGAITPVPGGVGPMTITMLLKNTVQSFQRRFN